ncbi:MAG: amino acid adenylation domain-containing protein, partial [Polyangiaceae bacterium]
QLPLLSSGKLDRTALPEPELEQRGSVAPVSAVQTRVAAIWQELLAAQGLGLDADFFALGGHSLLATQVVSRVRQAFAIELPLRELFEARDLGAFAERVQQALDAGRVAAQPPLVPVERTGPLPLSFAQERMWFLWNLEPESSAYNVGGAVQLRGALDRAALERALVALAERHEALRTTFPREQGVPVQRIAERASFPFLHVELAALAPGEREHELERLAQAEASRPFDLERGPLWRVSLLQLERERHVLVVTLHHIVAEGWAMDVFARECAALYEAFAAGLPSPLAPLPVQYADYAAWQRQWLESGEAERQLEFWRRTLGSEHPVLTLASDRPRPAEQSFRGDYHRFRLDRALSQRVRDFGVRHGATLSMIAMTALYALLHRHSGERDLRLGYPIANRVRPELEGLIGAFLNTQVLRVEVTPELAGGALLERVKQASLEAQAHQDVPFHRIVEALAPERSAAHTPLFQVMCNVQRWQFQQRRALAGLELEFLSNDARAAQFDLALDVSEIDSEIECALSYSLDLFEPATAERLALHWQRLLTQLVDEPERRIDAYALTSDDERAALLLAAQGQRATLEDETLHGAFEAQARRSPDGVALIEAERRLSYAELDARAEAWANLLAARGVGAETVVALCGARSLELVAALIGVLKAGGAYLPLDPDYPAERLAYMLADSGARLLLSDGSAPALPGVELRGVELLRLDALAPAAPRSAARVHPEQLAYCIYTSGSTGQPKGAGNTHRALLNRLRWMQSEYGVSADDRVLAKTSLAFDVSLGELFWPLVSGASVVLAPRGAEKDPLELVESIQRHAVTCVDLVPAQLAGLLACGALDSCQTLRLVTVGGEALPPESAHAFLERHPAALYNMYGPSEAAVDVAYFRCHAGDLARGVPLGHAETNVALYVLDARLEPVPPLVSGELYIGGANLGRGYLGRAAATAAAFLPDPFAREPGQRLYRTGDLARRRADGVLE